LKTSAAERLRQDGGVIDHLGIQVKDFEAASAFYDAVLAPLGGSRLMQFGEVIGYGRAPVPDFWINTWAGEVDEFRESHICFQASDRTTVKAFFEAAVSAGAEVLHEPKVWPEYHEHYFGAFVRDPDGNNVEACCHLPES
jgi:catechol 2,3-dioxygenase-like lactoylglutathione lyase family enzyme